MKKTIEITSNKKYKPGCMTCINHSSWSRYGNGDSVLTDHYCHAVPGDDRGMCFSGTAHMPITKTLTNVKKEMCSQFKPYLIDVYVDR